MADVDSAFEKAKAIAAEATANFENIRTEEDSKIQLINRIITEVLGWSFSDIGAERKHENGYSDYDLSIGGRLSTIIEAKRTGSIPIHTTETNRYKCLKLSGPVLKDALDGIDQAASYAGPNGLPIAVLTDGLVWIIFKPVTLFDNFKNREAYVFPSIDAVLDGFSLFFDLLSKVQFSKRQYNVLFDRIHESRQALSRALVPPLHSSNIRISQRSDLAFDLENVFSSFFSRLTGDRDEEMLVECFVDTKESRIADFSLEKMTARILGNISPPSKDIDRELAALISETVDVDGGQTVFIVGPTGAGKSTFLKRFFEKTLSSSIRKRCLVLRANFLDASGEGGNALSWATNKLIELLEPQMYESGAPSWDELQGLYFAEYTRRSRGVDAYLYENDKDAFKQKFGSYLDDQVENDREGYLKRLLDDAIKNRKTLPVLVFDNLDEFSIEYKKSIFQFAQSLRRASEHCLLIFPITDKSAWTFSKTDIFGIYSSRSFFLPTPPPREVFRKRIDYLKSKIDSEQKGNTQGDYFSSQGIHISIDDLGSFAGVLETVFVDNDYTSKTIGELSNYNIRRMLELSKRIITSSVFRIEDLLKSFIVGTPFAVNRGKFFNALMKGDYEAYRFEDSYEVFPIFKVDSEIAQSPLLNLRILVLLDSIAQNTRRVDEKHLKVDSIIGYFDSAGCTEVAIDKSMLELLSANLIEPYDISRTDLSPGQLLAISHKGKAHLRLATRVSMFLEQMALTTPIANDDIAEKIRSDYRSKIPFEQKLREIRSTFVEYLIEEDQKFLRIPTDLETYHSQVEFVARLKSNAGIDVEPDLLSTDSANEDDGALPKILNGVLATIDWFDTSRGYGFADVEGDDVRAFVHASTLKDGGIDSVSDGDDILCDIVRTAKGPQVQIIHAVESRPEEIEVVKCTIVRLMADRGYGFAKVDAGPRDAYFNVSAFPEDSRETLATGTQFDAEIQPDKHGRGLQVKRVRI